MDECFSTDRYSDLEVQPGIFFSPAVSKWWLMFNRKSMKASNLSRLLETLPYLVSPSLVSHRDVCIYLFVFWILACLLILFYGCVFCLSESFWILLPSYRHISSAFQFAVLFKFDSHDFRAFIHAADKKIEPERAKIQSSVQEPETFWLMTLRLNESRTSDKKECSFVCVILNSFKAIFLSYNTLLWSNPVWLRSQRN